MRSLAEVDAHVAACHQSAVPALPALQATRTKVRIPGCERAPQPETERAQEVPPENEAEKIQKITCVQTSQRFLVQKYVEDPLLFRGRKFDIRCFALATARGECFVYERGYLRTASARFDPRSEDMGAHLCNNAV